jgi:hypothetical protein
MCDKCDQLDKAIAQYRRVSKQGFDPLTNERIKDAIDEMERRKVSLHPLVA